MKRNDFIKQVEKLAAVERAAGGKVDIDFRLPTVAITMSDGSEYFFQEHEASNLLDTVPPYLNESDFILWQAQGW